MKLKLIVCYHRVSPFENGGLSLLAVTPGLFEKQINYFEKKFKVVPLEEITESTSDRLLAITFDDGYLDNLTTVKEILEKKDLPATFFVVTDRLKGDLLAPVDILDTAFKSHQKLAELKKLISDAGIELNFLEDNYWSTLSNLYSLNSKDFENSLLAMNSATFVKQILVDDRERRHLALSELSTLASSSIFKVGAHSKSHRILSKIPINELEDEIRGSFEFLQSVLPVEKISNFFAIPFGQPDHYSEESLQIITSTGLSPLSTTPAGFSRRTLGEPVPRLCVQEWGPLRLRAALVLALFNAKFPKITEFLLSLFRRVLWLRNKIQPLVTKVAEPKPSKII